MTGRNHFKRVKGSMPVSPDRRFNRKFNTRRKSIERWHNIVMKLSEFEGLVNNYDGASPEEIRTLKAIHRKLYECQTVAKEHLREAENIDEFLRDKGGGAKAMKKAVEGASKWLIEHTKRNPIPYKLFKSILDKQIEWARNNRGVMLNFGELSEAVKAELLKGGIYVMSADGKPNKSPNTQSASLFATSEEPYTFPELTLSFAYSEPILPRLFGWLCRVFDEASAEGIAESRFTVNAVKENKKL